MRRGIPKKLEVDIEVRHSDHESLACIAFVDKLSGSHFIEVRMAWKDFARLVLTNIHSRPGTAELRITDTLGMRRENQSVKLGPGTADVLANVKRTDENEFAQVCADVFWQEYRDLYDAGWRVWGERGYNGHRRSALACYTVNIERFVEAE